MANFVHTDSSGAHGGVSGPGKPAGQLPIVLARLPHVGSETAMKAASQVPATTAAVTNPAETVPPPQGMPQLDLRTEIDQRTRLHIADTPQDDQLTPASHFLDRQHATDRQHTPTNLDSPPRIHEPVAAQPAPAPTTAQPTSIGEKLSRLHAQLSPHAGLIVALALITSAGLLYWMIVGPTQTKVVPEFHNYEQEFGNGAFGVSVNADSEHTSNRSQPSDHSQPTEPQQPTANAWAKMDLPAPQQAAVTPATLVFPTPPAATDSKPVSTVPKPSLQFPETSRPQALDFAKIGRLPAESIDTPHRLPEIARGSSATSTR